MCVHVLRRMRVRKKAKKKEKNFFYLFPTLKPDVIFFLTLCLLAPTKEGPSAALSMNLDRAKNSAGYARKVSPFNLSRTKIFLRMDFFLGFEGQMKMVENKEKNKWNTLLISSRMFLL